jgi:hypothetical protein
MTLYKPSFCVPYLSNSLQLGVLELNLWADSAVQVEQLSHVVVSLWNRNLNFIKSELIILWHFWQLQGVSKYFFAYSLSPLVVALSDIVFVVVFRYLKTFHIPLSTRYCVALLWLLYSRLSIACDLGTYCGPKGPNLPKILTQKTNKA